MLLQYRAAAMAGLTTQIFWGIIRVMIFSAFYASSSTRQPMSHSEVITYIWLGQAFFAMLPWSLDSDIREMIRSGTVVYELLRPLDLYTTWFCRAIAMRGASTALRAVPIFVVAGIFFGLRPPPAIGAGIGWAFAMLGALMLGAAITNLITISLLWTISGQGMARLMPACVWVLSGSIIPLPLFPDWAQATLNFLPFRDLVDTPYRLYMGHIPPQYAIYVLAHQAVWTAALVLLGRWLLARGTRRLVVHGG